MLIWVLYGAYVRSFVAKQVASDSSASHCGGRFIVGEDAVLCFLDLGPGAGEAEFRDAGTLIWRAKLAKANPNQVDRWFPEPARDIAKGHELFVRTVPSGPYTYLGPMSLDSAGGSDGAVAKFTLSTPLPTELWHRYRPRRKAAA